MAAADAGHQIRNPGQPQRKECSRKGLNDGFRQNVPLMLAFLFAMLLDVSILRLLSKDDFRVLRAVELGMRNHEIVPVPLIVQIARLRQSISLRSIRELLKHKLLHHENVQYDGYRLTTAGYDFLAIHTLVCRDQIHGFGRRIGTGKESDVYEVMNENGEVMIMKLHRLGRISFRAVKNKRDYLRHRKNFNWLYLSRLAALGEYAFMKALFDRGFPTPVPIDQNRHVVLMSVVKGYPLSQIKTIGHPGMVFEKAMHWFAKFVEVGLVHCDFNEFNLMVDEDEDITIIDFPQMVSVWHDNAEELFDRDRECIITFFKKRFNYDPDRDTTLEIVCPDFNTLMQKHCEPTLHEGDHPLDQELRASGFKKSHREILAKHAQGEDLDNMSFSDAASESSAPTDPENSEKDDEQSEGSAEEVRRQQGSSLPSKTRIDVAQRVTLEQKRMMAKDIRRRAKKNTNKRRGKRSMTTIDM